MNKKTKWLSAAVLCTAFSSPSFAGWEVTWIDKFEGDSVDWTNWTAQTQANYNNEVQCYTDDDSSADRNYEVSDGTLKIIARKNDSSTYCDTVGENKTWTSGRLNSKDKQEFLYGRVEARIKFHDLEGGTWPAFWMLENRINEQPVQGDDDFAAWPTSGAGEIDVWEWFSNSPDTYITNFYNTVTYTGPDDGTCGGYETYTYPNGAADVQDWHVYAMEWTADQIDFYVDNQLVVSQDVSSCNQYEEPMFVLINLAMGGNLGGSIDSSLELATYEIDYVAHCQESDSSTATYCNEDTIVSDDYSSDTEEDVVENAYIAYSGEDDTFSMTYWADVWGTETSILETSTYDKSFELTPGTGWGGASWAVIAWGNDIENAVDISDYSIAKFKVESGIYESVTVSVQNGNDSETSEQSYTLSDGEDLGNGWVEISASLPRFTGMTWFGLMFEGTEAVEIADVYFVGTSSSDDSVDDEESGSSDNTESSSDEPVPGAGVGYWLILMLCYLAVWRRR